MKLVIDRTSYNYEDFKQYSNFSNPKQYNNNNESFLAVHKKDLSPTLYIAFKRFIKLAFNEVKGVFGVVYANINYIVKQLNKLDVQCTGISRSSVRRMLAKMVEFGLIDVIHSEDLNGKQSANLYVFNIFGQGGSVGSFCQPIEQPMKKAAPLETAPRQQEDISQLNTRNTGKSLNTNNNKDKERSTRELDHTFIVDDKLKRFLDEVTTFFTDYTTVKEYTKAIHQNSRNYKRVAGYVATGNDTKAMIDNEIQVMGIDAFKRMIAVVKDKRMTRKPIVNPIGLFVKIFRDTVRETLFGGVAT